MGSTGADWERLAELLIARRVQLGYHRRVDLVRAKNLSASQAHMLGEIERHERTNFSAPTLALIEHAYEWATGSIRRVLAGGSPTPLEEAEHGIRVVDERARLTKMRQELHRLVDLVSDRDVPAVRDHLMAVVEHP